MRTPTFCWWGVLSISCLALLTAWAQTGRPQPALDQVAPPLPDDKVQTLQPDVRVTNPDVKLPEVTPASAPAPIPPRYDVPAITVPTAKPAAAPAPVPPSTCEELMAELDAVQKQKAELEKRERDLKAKLQERLKELEVRLKKMGVVPVTVSPFPAKSDDLSPPPAKR
jgi:hypothetical protein